jgi:hypothetical protein
MIPQQLAVEKFILDLIIVFWIERKGFVSSIAIPVCCKVELMP